MQSRGTVLALALASLVFTACGTQRSGGEGDGTALSVTAVVVGTPIDVIVIDVTAPDLATPLVFNLTAVDGVAAGTIRVSPGTARTIRARGYDTTGEITHEGSVTVDVARGTNAAVSIPMVPRSGQLPVSVVIGPVSIVVQPLVMELVPGGTAQATAIIRAPSGELVIAAPQWASTDPSVATVDDLGLVTARRDGDAQIVATYGGTAGVASLHVATTALPSYPGTVRQLGTAGGDRATAVFLGSAGDLLLAGVVGDAFPGFTSAGLSDAFVANLDPLAAPVWTSQFGSADAERVSSAAIDAAGDVYLVAQRWTTSFVTDGGSYLGSSLEKVSAAGLHEWSQPSIVASGWTLTQIASVAAAPGGDGVLVAAMGSGGSLVATVDGAGLQQAVTSVVPGFAFDVASSAAGPVVSGCFANTTGTSFCGPTSPAGGAFVTAFDAAGSVRWDTRLSDLTVSQVLTTIALDAAGDVYAAGHRTVVGSGNTDVVLVKLDGATGAVLWTRVLDWSAFEMPSQVALDAAGDVYVVGFTDGGGFGGRDAFVMKLDPAGTELWMRSIGTAASDHGSAIAIGANGVVVVGSTAGAFPGATNAGNTDVFITTVGFGGEPL
ncbi:MULTISPECIES: Ig-like domain-containing protein [unclassified Anaeromyxobacter]|uniref:Ig-like domain-containing protein n=1 Tax=unclassified Anaeromyxobacter TaxID=2620896 RepID=UPI001F5A8DD2|nr:MULTISPECIES: Ig-like domain-containing protein [unclassified Anaeromyxobacter]